MLATRLRRGGSGGFTPPTPTPPAGLAQILTSPKGGWAEPQRSKAIFYNGYTYVGWVAGGSGDVGVSAVENADFNVSSVTLHAALGGEGTADMHDNPGLLVRDSDHRLFAAYCRHADTVIRWRISVNSLDTDPTLSGGFATEVMHDPATTVNDYPVILQQLSETNDPIYIFYRSTFPSNTARWLYIVSTDGGVTWSANRWLYRNSGFVTYGQINGNGTDRIDFVFQDKNEEEVTNNALYHWYLTGGSFYKSDGTLIGAAPLANPLVPANVTLAADSAGYHMTSLERNTGSGDIAFTVAARVSGVHHVKRVMWDGATWAVDEITTSDAPYSWGNVIDPNDFDHALVSKWVSGRAELYDCVFSGTWTCTALTSGSVADWLWPIFVRDYATEIKAVVLYGTYTTYTNYGFATYGWA